MNSIKLIVVGGDINEKEIELTLPATIGRGRDVSVNLPHPLVSRRHCEVVQRQGRIVVRDLDSLNGTFVGSEQVSEAILKPGDLLTVGTVTFRASYEAAEPINDARTADSETLRETNEATGRLNDTLRTDVPPPNANLATDGEEHHGQPAEYDA